MTTSPPTAGDATTAGAEDETDADQATGGETSGIPDGEELDAHRAEARGQRLTRPASRRSGSRPATSPTSTWPSRTSSRRRRARPTWSGSCSTRRPATRCRRSSPRQGSFNDRFAIPPAVTGLIFNPRLGAVDRGRASPTRRQTLTEIQQAAQDETFQIERPGRTVLEARIPDVPAAGRPGLGPGRLAVGQELAGVHDPGRVEALLQRTQRLDARPRPPRRACTARGRGPTAWWWVIVPPVATIASQAAVLTARHCSISAPALRGRDEGEVERGAVAVGVREMAPDQPRRSLALRAPRAAHLATAP